MPNRRERPQQPPPTSVGDGGTPQAPDPLGVRLERCREMARDGLPASVAGMLRAADAIADEWNRHRVRRMATWMTYEENLSAERHAQHLLTVVLDAVDALTGTGAGPAAPIGPLLEPIPPPYTSLTYDPRLGGPSFDFPDLDDVIDESRHHSLTPPVPSSGEPEREPDAHGPLEAHLLGPFRLERAGRILDGWQGVKAPRVARYLFAQRGRPVAREVLMELFWPELDPETARRALHQAIYQIRRTLRAEGESPERIVHRGDAYILNTDDWWCDVEEFERRAETGRRADQAGDGATAVSHYRTAVNLYRGDLLEDTPFEEWSMYERDRLRLLFLDIGNRLADLVMEDGDVATALEVTQRVLRSDPCDEVAHRRAMRCYADVGQRTAVIRQYQTCADALNRTFELDPDVETTKLYEASIGE